MNTIFCQRTAFLLSLTTLTVVSSGLSAKAQTTDLSSAAQITTLPAQNKDAVAQIQSDQTKTSSEEVNTTTAEDSVKTPIDTTALTSASALMAEFSTAQISEATSEITNFVIAQNGTVAPETNPSTNQTAPGTLQDETTPGTRGVAPGRATRSGSSYIGIGGNIGFGGDTTLSEGAFSVFSKVGLTRNLSVRPAALIGDNAVFLVPVTIDFPTEDLEITQVTVAPYVGGGLAISTGRDSTVGALITGGVDVPISPRITATAGVNVGFVDETEVGILLGVGYNY
jgi:hypothetical protein